MPICYCSLTYSSQALVETERAAEVTVRARRGNVRRSSGRTWNTFYTCTSAYMCNTLVYMHRAPRCACVLCAPSTAWRSLRRRTAMQTRRRSHWRCRTSMRCASMNFIPTRRSGQVTSHNSEGSKYATLIPECEQARTDMEVCGYYCFR